MKKVTAGSLVFGAIGIIALAVPLTRTALASDQTAAASAQPATAQSSPFPSWSPTGPYTGYGPGTIAPDGAPNYIGNGPPAGCPAVSGNQQGGNQSSAGGYRHHRQRGTQGGQQPSPAPSQPSGS
jgi:hypothetical protein